MHMKPLAVILSLTCTPIAAAAEETIAELLTLCDAKQCAPHFIGLDMLVGGLAQLGPLPADSNVHRACRPEAVSRVTAQAIALQFLRTLPAERQREPYRPAVIAVWAALWPCPVMEAPKLTPAECERLARLPNGKAADMPACKESNR